MIKNQKSYVDDITMIHVNLGMSHFHIVVDYETKNYGRTKYLFEVNNFNGQYKETMKKILVDKDLKTVVANIQSDDICLKILCSFIIKNKKNYKYIHSDMLNFN